MTSPLRGVACTAITRANEATRYTASLDRSACLELGHGRTIEARVEPVRELGRGRAARAVLFRVETPDRCFDAVEKHFAPAALTRAIYHLCFAAPFPYTDDHDAALSCLYRRRVASALLATIDPATHWLADALYVRRCSGGHYALGTEHIEGRALAPAAIAPELGGPPDELPELLRRMRLMERTFLDTGMIGTGWQVSTATIVATANFIRTPAGEPVCIDIESGMPALVAPRYLWMSLTGRPMPMFDDLDEHTLQTWLSSNRERLRAALGPQRDVELAHDVEALIAHTRRWKRREPAFGRHGLSLARDPQLRGAIRERLLARWKDEDRLDTESLARLAASDRLFSHPLVLTGALPTRFGRGLHRIAGNRAFRREVASILLDRHRLDGLVRHYQLQLRDRLHCERRLDRDDDGGLSDGLGSVLATIRHRGLSAIASPRAHRLLTDWSYAGASLRLAATALASERVQEWLARSFLENATRRWQAMGRLDDAGRERLLAELRDGEASDHLRGFGTHLALKFFSPLTNGVKVAGVALLATPWAFLGVAMILNTSLLRTLLTIPRWWHGRRRGSSYAIAFAVGALPLVGALAFPMQLHHGRPDLSRFLLRWILSQLATSVPVFGGTSTRLEIVAVNLATGLSRMVAWTVRAFPDRSVSSSTTAPTRSDSDGWWSRQVDEALRWLQEEDVGAGEVSRPAAAQPSLTA